MSARRRSTTATPQSSSTLSKDQAQEKENSVKKSRRAVSLGGDALKRAAAELEDGNDGLTPNKRARRSAKPRRSILKPAPEPEEHTEYFEPTATGDEIRARLARNGPRKSEGRRVSFASHCFIRLFGIDDPKSPEPSSDPPGTPEGATVRTSRRRSSTGSDMDIANDDITAAFQPFLASSSASPPEDEASSDAEGEDDTGAMDLTEAVGGILSNSTTDPGPSSPARLYPPIPAFSFSPTASELGSPARPAPPPPRAHSGLSPTSSEFEEDSDGSGRDNENEEQTMDFTLAMGSIIPNSEGQAELVGAVRAQLPPTFSHSPGKGGLKRFSLAQPAQEASCSESESDGEDMDEQTMDVTQAVGGILSVGAAAARDDDEEGSESEDEMDMEMTGEVSMDVTKAVGQGILSVSTHAPAPASASKSPRRASTSTTATRSARFSAPTAASLARSLPASTVPPPAASKSSRRRASTAAAANASAPMSPHKPQLPVFVASPLKRVPAPALASPTKNRNAPSSPSKPSSSFFPSPKKPIAALAAADPFQAPSPSSLAARPNAPSSPFASPIPCHVQSPLRPPPNSTPTTSRIATTPRKSPAPKATTPRRTAPKEFAAGEEAEKVLEGLLAEDEDAEAEGMGNWDEELPDPISLSDFLEMTDMRFMDGIASVKRRSTLGGHHALEFATTARAPYPDTPGGAPGLVDYVKAATVTVPQLEMMLWCCQELKRYIAEGAEAIAGYERGVEEMNPPVIVDYLRADDDYRARIEAQLKIVKHHSRLDAKRVWYTWRRELVQNHRESLEAAWENLQTDKEVIQLGRQETKAVLPELQALRDKLKLELEKERKVVQDLAECDQEHLVGLKEAIAEQSQQIEAYRAESASNAEELDRLNARVQEKRDAIDAVRNSIAANRAEWESVNGCTKREAMRRLAEFERLQDLFLWRPTKLTPERIEMVYDRELAFAFDTQGRSLELTLVNEQPRKDGLGAVDEFALGRLQAAVEDEALAQKGVPQIVQRLTALWIAAQRAREQVALLLTRYPLKFEPVPTRSAFVVKATVFLPKTRAKFILLLVLPADVLTDWPGSSAGIEVRVKKAYGAIEEDKLLQAATARTAKAQMQGVLLDAALDAVACYE